MAIQNRNIFDPAFGGGPSPASQGATITSITHDDSSLPAGVTVTVNGTTGDITIETDSTFTAFGQKLTCIFQVNYWVTSPDCPCVDDVEACFEFEGCVEAPCDVKVTISGVLKNTGNLTGAGWTGQWVTDTDFNGEHFTTVGSLPGIVTGSGNDNFQMQLRCDGDELKLTAGPVSSWWITSNGQFIPQVTSGLFGQCVAVGSSDDWVVNLSPSDWFDGASGIFVPGTYPGSTSDPFFQQTVGGYDWGSASFQVEKL